MIVKRGIVTQFIIVSKFIMALLQSQMTRFHEDVRPRITNPTFASINVGSTLGMHFPSIYRMQNNYSTVKLTREQPIQENTPIRRRSNSQLSNIATNSLKSLNRFISDKEVYDKQQRNYNIISVQPKEYEDTIKVYPKYRLQNEDRNYYKKMQIENQITNKLNTKKQMMTLRQSMNPEVKRSSQQAKNM